MNDKKFLIASDIDGTLIPHEPDESTNLDISAFNKAIESNNTVFFAYVTGRHLELALDGINKFNLKIPDIFVCDVGTSIYDKKGSRWLPDEKYRQIMEDSWGGFSREYIAEALKNVKGLEEQEEEKLKEFKQSYYLPMGSEKTVIQKINEILSPKNIKTSIIYSVDEKKNIGLLDILPKNASKDSALKYLQNRLEINADNVVYAGDSGNDIEAFLSGYKAIVVKNTITEVVREVVERSKEKNLESKIYFTEKKHSAGVLEGLRYFGFVK